MFIDLAMMKWDRESHIYEDQKNVVLHFNALEARALRDFLDYLKLAGIA